MRVYHRPALVEGHQWDAFWSQLDSLSYSLLPLIHDRLNDFGQTFHLLFDYQPGKIHAATYVYGQCHLPSQYLSHAIGVIYTRARRVDCRTDDI